MYLTHAKIISALEKEYGKIDTYNWSVNILQKDRYTPYVEICGIEITQNTNSLKDTLMKALEYRHSEYVPNALFDRLEDELRKL